MLTPPRAAGFTLVELVTVMSVVGVLSVVALPKMADLGQDARIAKLAAARGAVLESAHRYHMKWIVAGSQSTETVIDGVALTPAGYPTAAGIVVAAGVADGFDTRVAGTIAADAEHPGCSFVYAPDGGTATPVDAGATHC